VSERIGSVMQLVDGSQRTIRDGRVFLEYCHDRETCHERDDRKADHALSKANTEWPPGEAFVERDVTVTGVTKDESDAAKDLQGA
jgi:hypothetical protein